MGQVSTGGPYPEPNKVALERLYYLSMAERERHEDDVVSARMRVPVSPPVLRWARESSGSTLEEAAQRIQQDPAVVAAWEAGQSEPTLGALGELAHLYDRPLAVFLLDEPPDEPARPPDLRSAACRAKGPLTRKSVLASRRARRMQGLVRAIRGTGGWARPDVDQPGLDPDAITSMAKAARRLLDVSLADQRSWPNKSAAFSRWRAAIERTGVLVLQADLPLDDVRALSVAGDPPAIVINEHDWAASKVYSLFHEYGHVLWGYEGICSPLDAGPASSSIEKACDLFAGMVLVPADQLIEDPVVRGAGSRLGSISAGDLGRIAASYNVSDMVIWYRLRQSGLISASAFSGRWEEWGPPRRRSLTARRPRIPAWAKAKWRLGGSLGGELLNAEERGNISIGDALAGLEVRLEDLEKLRSALG